jgi:FdhD protein
MSAVASPPLTGSQTITVRRHEGELANWAQDQIVTELPVALVFNGLSHAVMMVTPTDLEDFALGFALSEGLIERASDCHDIEAIESEHGIELQLQVSARAFESIKAHRRLLSGRTGCGLCGIDSLQSFQRSHPTERSRLNAEPIRPKVHAATVLHALAQLAPHQALQTDTGGCHAAAWANPDGELLVVREDVGRHNALDKLIGHLARTRPSQTGQQTHNGIALVSSRASYELVSKCARVGIPTLASISAPTSMAVELARRLGLQLYGFCRGERAVDYTAAP